ncbi:NAD+ synthase [Spirulina sp. CCNP1310]|uniref:NAD+ synthase n=1 Tax=Spirulina sp. CCNP1310 TaxID=3110249 RepID=UPI002B1EB01B|nr:NAD+ synthase [Spirulina sp. CCNP1310]MEA5421047.1 NAD+ synthase [Spirulina sp. CCNP1310]
MKVAIAQLNPTIGDLKGNAAQILAAAEGAIAQGANLLLTPELSLCGYPPRDLLLQPSFITAMADQLVELAQALPPALTTLVGIAQTNAQAQESGQKPLFNAMALLHGGEVQQFFPKRLLPTYDVFDEDRYFEPGDQPNEFTLEGIRFGVTICEDLWNDDQFWGKRQYSINPIADLANLGVNVILNLSASPYRVGIQALREAMLIHASQRFNVPIFYVNQVGGNDDLIFDGQSVAVHGAVCHRSAAFRTDLAVVDLTAKPVQLPPLADEPMAEIWQALVLGVRDYARKCGFKSVVLGLSGGIDSALVAAIAAEALGPDHVLGVLMPSPYSSDHSITDAEALVNHLGIQRRLIPIEPAMKAFDQLLDPLFRGTEFGIAEENLQSRIRGNVLMAIANKFGHLLLSTGNKSEMAVGYCTLYGDMNGGLAVIADVPKTQVFALCRWLNREREIIPPNVITKPPSAELKPGQLDQDSLPPYEVLDDILARYLEERQGMGTILAAGHDRATVERVVRLVSRAEFKRRQAPPGLKITDRAFGTGWRMPIACRMG